MTQRFERTQLDEIDPVRCPCGFARRAFDYPENQTATLHLVDIQEDARTHYHKRLTEIYLVLEGEGEIELDGERFPIKPCLLYTSPSPRDATLSRMPSSA